MRGGPYKPRLPRDRKLWPVVFSPPFHCTPHTPLRVSTIATTTTAHRVSTFSFFDIVLASHSLWGNVRLTALYHFTLFLSLALLPLRGTRFLLFFDRIWISRYKLSPCPVGALPPFLYMPTRGRSGKTNSIFSSKNFAYSRTSESSYISRCCLKGSVLSTHRFHYLLVLHKITERMRSLRSHFSDLHNFVFDITEYDICIFIYIYGFYNLV